MAERHSVWSVWKEEPTREWKVQMPHGRLTFPTKRAATKFAEEARELSLPRVIARGGGFEFWRIGNDVYRALVNPVLDNYGVPLAKRWECSYHNWEHYRIVFAWATDV